MINWKKDYSVEHQEIDEQHKVLIRMLNDIDAIIQKEDFNYLNLVHTVEELEEYVKVHFTYEEHLMVNHSYPGILEHTKTHNLFRDKLQNTYILDIEKPRDFYYEMSEYLMQWLMHHIQSADKQLGQYLMDPIQ